MFLNIQSSITFVWLAYTNLFQYLHSVCKCHFVDDICCFMGYSFFIMFLVVLHDILISVFLNSFVISMIPVSYTHLDVYKRQGLYVPRSDDQFMLPFVIFFSYLNPMIRDACFS